MLESARQTLRRARNGEERLWKIWCLGGIPVAWMAGVLTAFAEDMRIAGAAGSGDLLDVVKLLLYFWWFRLAWACARNVDSRIWTPVSRLAACGGLLLTVLV